MKMNINMPIKKKYIKENEKKPINKNLDIALKNIIIMYSAIKIIAKIPPLYSVLNPDTNSLSPSAKSKGVRFNSAVEEIIHNKKLIKKKIFKNIFCVSNNLKRLREFIIIIFLKIMKISETS